MVQVSITHDEDAGVQLHLAITSALREGCSLEEQAAAALAEPIVQALRRQYACEDLYVPAPDKRSRNAAIRREFNGRNRYEIMKRYNISRTRLYEIVSSAD